MSPAHASGGGIDDGALALMVVLCLRDDNISNCPDDSALVLLVPFCLHDDDEAPQICQLSVAHDSVLVPLVAPCSCNDGKGNSAWEGSGNGASTPLIPFTCATMTMAVAVAALMTAPWHCLFYLAAHVDACQQRRQEPL